VSRKERKITVKSFEFGAIAGLDLTIEWTAAGFESA
jgi:hypothetical protein